MLYQLIFDLWQCWLFLLVWCSSSRFANWFGTNDSNKFTIFKFRSCNKIKKARGQSQRLSEKLKSKRWTFLVFFMKFEFHINCIKIYLETLLFSGFAGNFYGNNQVIASVMILISCKQSLVSGIPLLISFKFRWSSFYFGVSNFNCSESEISYKYSSFRFTMWKQSHLIEWLTSSKVWVFIHILTTVLYVLQHY